ncbi:MAG: hypothetical protein LBD76_03585 [Prevotellaceae bacterium]|nr:hypothetical protein [Prevotellaceae bacterium]
MESRIMNIPKKEEFTHCEGKRATSILQSFNLLNRGKLAVLIVIFWGLSIHLAAQSGCAVTGTVIFKEDFDHYDNGLEPTSGAYSTEELVTGMTTYNFTSVPGQILGYPNNTGMYGEGSYSLVKDAYDADNPTSYLSQYRDDHTSPDNPAIGRFFITNGRTSPDRVYRQVINNLCSGTNLYFHFG